jgi:hypothetical protein
MSRRRRGRIRLPQPFSRRDHDHPDRRGQSLAGGRALRPQNTVSTDAWTVPELLSFLRR